MTRPRKSTSPYAIPLTVAAGGLAVFGAGLAWLAYMRTNIWHNVALTAALDGELRMIGSDDQIAYYHAATGRPGSTPLLFVHGISMAASAYEAKPLFDRFESERPMAALDLPGFGFSARGPREYSATVYADAILSVAQHAFPRGQIDLVAMGMGGEFAALAAARQPERFRTLTLVAPTGLSGASWAPPPAARMVGRLERTQVGLPLFDTLVSRPSLRYAIAQSQRRGFDQGLFHYAYATSHQPGAADAPYAYLTGKLDTPEILSVYASLRLPALAILSGGAYANPAAASALARKPNWRIVDWTGSCGTNAQFDDPDGVCRLIDSLGQNRGLEGR